jgi:nucleoside-diphosphate-sugar epimerase
MDRMIDEHLDVKDSKDNFAYFKSKLYAEREVWRGIAEGLNAVIINPSTILGGGFWSVPPNALFGQVHRGIPFYTAGTNGFVDVRDVVSVAIQIMDSDISAEKFIVSAENLSWNEMIWMIADIMKIRRPFIKVSKPIASLAWRLDAVKSLFSGRPPIVTRDSINLALSDFRYSNDKVCKALNFTFRPLHETVAETTAVYQRSVQNKSLYGLLN